MIDYFQVLCGNKSDLEATRVVPTSDGEELGKKEGVPFLETSAKTGVNVQEAIEALVKSIPRTGIKYKVWYTRFDLWGGHVLVYMDK